MRVAIVTVLLCVCWIHIHAGPVEIVETAAQENTVQDARLTNCPYGWMKHDTRCFLMVSSRKKWFDAETFCAEKNACLASVRSSSDYNFLVSLTSIAGEPYAWIGGFWLQSVWGWSDRSPYIYTKWHSKTTEASNSCLRMYSTYGWSNVNCMSSYAFVCAKDILAC